MKSKPLEKTRINLLPAKDKNRIARNKKRLIIFMVIAGYIVFICLMDLASFVGNGYKKAYISQLNQRLNVLKTKNILNETFESAIDKRKILLKDLRKKIELINDLKNLKVAWNEKINEIVAASPSGVWMNGLSLEKGVVAVNGNSVSLSGISTYINNLKKTGLFTKITLNGARRKIISGNTFYSFDLKALLNLVNYKYRNKK